MRAVGETVRCERGKHGGQTHLWLQINTVVWTLAAVLQVTLLAKEKKKEDAWCIEDCRTEWKYKAALLSTGENPR